MAEVSKVTAVLPFNEKGVLVTAVQFVVVSESAATSVRFVTVGVQEMTICPFVLAMPGVGTTATAGPCQRQVVVVSP